MKSKVIRGKGFKGCVSYVFDTKNKHNEKPDLIGSNMSSKSHGDFIKEFVAVRECRTDIERPVWHTSLSLPKGETLTDKEWRAVAESYLTKMGFDIDNHQYLIVRHKNTDQDHIHIIANRIGLDGSVWHGRHEAFKSIEACQQVEKEFLLNRTQGLRGSRKDVSMPSQNEIEQAIRIGEKPARVVLQNALQAALCDKPDLQSFITRLQTVGIEPRFNVADTGNVAGVSFSVRDVAFKGSTLGKKFSWNTIKGIVKYEKDRDNELVRSLSSRNNDEPDNIGRSSVESDFSNDRAIIRDNDDSLGVGQYRAKSDSRDINNSKEVFRYDDKLFKNSEKCFRPTSKKIGRATKKATETLNGIKRRYGKEASRFGSQSCHGSRNDKFTGGSIGRILHHTERALSATYKFRLNSSSIANNRAAEIEKIRKKLGLNDFVIRREENKSYTNLDSGLKNKSTLNNDGFKKRIKNFMEKTSMNGVGHLSERDENRVKPKKFGF
ncbi:relaxase/mobilization nuclease domain-containing protein [Enterobacter ludwigii]